MTREFFVIGILLLSTIAAEIQDNTSNEVFKLGYNPTYDLWYFTPSGRPDHVPASVQDAYNEKRPGGVCYTAQEEWFYCNSLENINKELRSVL